MYRMISRVIMISMAVQRLKCTPHYCSAFFTQNSNCLLSMKSCHPQRVAFSLLSNNCYCHMQQRKNDNVSGSTCRMKISSMRLFTSVTDKTNNDGDDTESSKKTTVETTWTYEPYKPPPPGKTRRINNVRNYSSTSLNNNSKNDNWIIPNKITIPEDKIDMSFERSSGAGGQNVNKVNTKVLIKMNVMEATWIPDEVRQRIAENEANKINKDGSLIISSQEYRTQAQNRKDAIDKLEAIILKNYPRPKVRKMRKGISKKSKERNKAEKRFNSEKKQNRKRIVEF